MRARVWCLHVAFAASLLHGFAAPMPAQIRTPQPYASIATDGEGYAGPGRNAADDLKASVLRIGLLAPLHGPRKTEGEAMVAAARLALQDAAPHGRVRGRRVELAVEDASGPSWGMVSDAVIRLVLNDDVIAVITSTSGTDTHLVEQVGNRIGVPVLTLSTDATTTQIDIPWIFRIGASDVEEAKAIAHDIHSVRGLRDVLLITQKGHDGQRGIDAMREAASGLGALAPDGIALEGTDADLQLVAKKLQANPPQAVVIWTDAPTTSSVLDAIHTATVKELVYCSQDAASSLHEMPQSSFAARKLWTIAEDGEDPGSHQHFGERYQQAADAPPTLVAARTFDAVTLTVRALQKAGPNRARVRDQLAQTNAYDGASGRLTFDLQGNDNTEVHLVELK